MNYYFHYLRQIKLIHHNKFMILMIIPILYLDFLHKNKIVIQYFIHYYFTIITLILLILQQELISGLLNSYL